jgi:putative PIN family toxin of toxin-antitoxin system
VRIVFDSCVLIPLAIARSLSSRLFGRLEQAGHTIITSPSILKELREKMLASDKVRKWIAISDEDVHDFLELLPSSCFVVEGKIELSGEVPLDPDDDHILAAAVEGEATHLVTEDRHLLSLDPWRGISILTRTALMAELDRNETT